MYTIRIIGPGRAGTSLGSALAARGWSLAGYLGRDDDVSGAARGVDVLVVATPDDTVAEVAALVEPVPSTTVVHLSGSLGLDALAPHPRRGGLHPLVPLPNAEVGAARLVSGVTFAVAGRVGGGRHGTQSRGSDGRGGRRRPRRLPRRRMHRGQPRGGAARPGRARRRFGRAEPRVLPPAHPGRARRRRPAGARSGPDGAGAPGRLGDAQPASRRAGGRRAARVPGRSRSRHQVGRCHGAGGGVGVGVGAVSV